MSKVKPVVERKPEPSFIVGAPEGGFANKGVRETIESVVIAFILAFLFRTFEAEAFVIPTGSMATTLMGRHRDVVCDKCGYRYQITDSDASGMDPRRRHGDPLNFDVVGGTCPICRRSMEVNPDTNANHCAFSGDRILVNKFTYDFSEPQRWDVIVFKYPGNAKINYIKRLIGLPGETIKIRHGDIYVSSADTNNTFRIARKPPQKQLALLIPIDDTQHLPADWVAAGWPLRWQGWSADKQFDDRSWQSPELAAGREFTSGGQGESWLRYRNFLPDWRNWAKLENPANDPGENVNASTPRPIRPELVADFVAYNAPLRRGDRSQGHFGPDPNVLGHHWVGDLGLEARVDVQSASGELLLLLVEGGRNHECRINVETGAATLSMRTAQGEPFPFTSDDGQRIEGEPTAATSLKGPGTFSVRFTNVDDELRVWINNRLVEFDRPTTYVSPPAEQPYWSPKNPGDMAPVGIGSRDLSVQVSQLRVLRDAYYIAVSENYDDEYEVDGLRAHSLDEVFTSPQLWATTALFQARREIILPALEAKQYLPLGDNSAQSKDARLWTDEAPPFVHRDLLIGKAMVIYWPHPWNTPLPYVTPNFSNMGLIR